MRTLSIPSKSNPSAPPPASAETVERTFFASIHALTTDSLQCGVLFSMDY
jgi:hypothetical protein